MRPILPALAAFLILAVAATAPAHAQPPKATRSSLKLDRPPFKTASPPADSRAKSPGAAAAFAAIPAAVGTTLALAGLFDNTTLAYAGLGILTVGPSTGHIYAGAPGRGLATMGLRTVGAVAFVAGLKSVSWEICGDDHDCETEEEDSTTLIWAGGALIVATTLYDIIGAPAAAHQHNQNVQVTPTVMASPSGPVGGLAVVGAF